MRIMAGLKAGVASPVICQLQHGGLKDITDFLDRITGFHRINTAPFGFTSQIIGNSLENAVFGRFTT